MCSLCLLNRQCSIEGAGSDCTERRTEKMAPTLEVCVDNFESVQATVEGGATRVELCSSLLDGGLTPSVGFQKHVKNAYPELVVFPMIRPRGGDFCYSTDELHIMAADIDALKEAGADGKQMIIFWLTDY